MSQCIACMTFPAGPMHWHTHVHMLCQAQQVAASSPGAPCWSCIKASMPPCLRCASMCPQVQILTSRFSRRPRLRLGRSLKGQGRRAPLS